MFSHTFWLLICRLNANTTECVYATGCETSVTVKHWTKNAKLLKIWMKIPNMRVSLLYVKCKEFFECCHSGQNGSGVLCLWRITDQVCLGQKGFFWHSRVVWKFLEASLRLWAFRASLVAKVRSGKESFGVKVV